MIERVGRNDPCPCGSGKKYKNCHMIAEKETTAAKYTASGKRKFKARVLSSSAKSLEVFGRSATVPQIPSESPTLEKLKFRKTTKDFRQKVKEAPLSFHIPSEKPQERERHLPEPDQPFKPTNEDFREKKE